MRMKDPQQENHNQNSFGQIRLYAVYSSNLMRSLMKFDFTLLLISSISSGVESMTPVDFTIKLPREQFW